MKKNLGLIICIIILSCETVFSQVSIQATQSTICAGGQVTLYAIGGTSQALWQPSGIDSKSITVSPATTTTYTLTSGPYTASYTVNVCENATCTTTGSFNPLLLNTGNNGSTVMLPFDNQDLHWMYSGSINGTYLPTFVSDNADIPGNYSRTLWSNAQWIGPNGTLTSPGSGNYFFRIQFNLTAEEANSLILDMNFMADNTVIGVSVNNILVPNSGTPGSSIYGFQSPNAASVNMQGHWVEGLNTISIEINDLGGYMGFVGQLNPQVAIPTPTVTCENSVSVTNHTLAICKGDSVQLEAKDAVFYSWLPTAGLSNPSIANPKASPSSQTTYIVKGMDSMGHASFDSIVVLVHGVPYVQLGSRDTIKCSDQPFVLNVASLGATVLWQDGSSNSVYTLSDTGVYYVQVTNQCGTTADTIRVHGCCETISVPNLFTPNGDRHNDYFNIGCLGGGGWNLKVYNRWGSMVYANNDYQNNWNGNNVSDGVYYYLLSKSNKQEYKGWVQVIR